MHNLIDVMDTAHQHYAIPESLVDDFYIMLRAIKECEWLSDQWYDAADSFDRMFSAYRT